MQQYQLNKMENISKAKGRDLPISTKQSIEICNFLRGKTLQTSKRILQEVIDEKQAIPFKRFNKDMGHRPGKIAAGRYPQKSCKQFIKILDSAEANAQSKGLNANSLIIKSISANRASRPARHGRHLGREMKRTHLDVVLEEKSPKQEVKKTEEKKNDRKEIPKPKN